MPITSLGIKSASAKMRGFTQILYGELINLFKKKNNNNKIASIIALIHDSKLDWIKSFFL